MLPLENQVCSLEPAMRLKELGVKQDSVFYWTRNINGYFIYSEIMHDPEDLFPSVLCSAFTVAELGEMLPRLVEKDLAHYFLEIFRDMDENWHIKYSGYLDQKLIQKYSQTEADDRAEMLIYLIENNLWKPEEITNKE